MCNQCQCNQTTSATQVSARADLVNNHIPTVPAIVGHRYETRDGQSVTIVRCNSHNSTYPMTSSIGISYRESGHCYLGEIHGNDLVRDLTIEEPRTGDTVPAIVGHRYRTRSQGVVTVEAYVAGDHFPYKTDKVYGYLESGKFYSDPEPHRCDLVKDLTLEAVIAESKGPITGTLQGKSLANTSSLLKINYRKPAVSPIESIEVLRKSSSSITVSADGPAMVSFRARGAQNEISYSLKLTEVDALVKALQLMKNQQLAANGAGQGVWGGSY
jgi:hypothetical protein